MKQVSLIIFLAAIVLLTGCKSPQEINSTGKIVVAVTIAPYAGIVKQIGGDKVDVIVLTPPNSSCETYEPTPLDISKASKSQIYFAVGANYAFENNLLQTVSENYKNIIITDCSVGLQVKDNNPHLWLYPAGLKSIAGTVCSELSKIKPELVSYFNSNKDNFIKKIDSIDILIKNNLAGLRQKKMLVFHPSWFYFASYYGIEQFAIEAEGKEPTVKSMKAIIDFAKENKIKVLFLEPTTNEDSANAIKEELKARICYLNPLQEDVLSNLLNVSVLIRDSFK